VKLAKLDLTTERSNLSFILWITSNAHEVCCYPRENKSLAIFCVLDESTEVFIFMVSWPGEEYFAPPAW
jgi:hypothetical protein